MKRSEAGFSLAEMGIAMGMVTILGLGLASMTQMTHESQMSASAQAELQAASLHFKHTLSRQNASGPTCRDALSFDGTVFDPAADIPVKLTYSEGTYISGAFAPGVRNLKIDKLYLSDHSFVSQNSAEKTYVSTLYIEASTVVGGKTLQLRRYPVATISEVIDTAGALTGCNLEVTLADNPTNCVAVDGFVWNVVLHKCQADIPRSGSAFIACPGGFQRVGINCVLAANGCGPGRVGTKFDYALVQDCQPPPAGYQILARPPAIAAAIVHEGTIAPLETSSSALAPFTVGAPVQIVGTGTTSPAPSCSDPTAVGETLYDRCVTDPTNCQAPLPVSSATRNLCSVTNSVDFNSSQVVANPPTDSAPPVSPTCICGNYRIDPAIDEVCLSCSYNDSGFLGLGQKTYHYQVNKCVSGELTAPWNYSTPHDPGGSHSNCKRALHRGICPSGSNCRQYYGDPDF